MDVIYVLGTIVALVGVAGIFGLLVWVTRRHDRMYSEGRERIGRYPESARAMRRFETMWTYFSGRGGSGGL